MCVKSSKTEQQLSGYVSQIQTSHWVLSVRALVDTAGPLMGGGGERGTGPLKIWGHQIVNM